MTFLDLLINANEKLKRSHLHFSYEYIVNLAEELKDLPVYRAIEKLIDLNDKRRYNHKLLYKETVKQTRLYQVIDEVNYNLRLDSCYPFHICVKNYAYFDDDNFKIEDLIFAMDDWDFDGISKGLKKKYIAENFSKKYGL